MQEHRLKGPCAHNTHYFAGLVCHAHPTQLCVDRQDGAHTHTRHPAKLRAHFESIRGKVVLVVEVPPQLCEQRGTGRGPATHIPGPSLQPPLPPLAPNPLPHALPTTPDLRQGEGRARGQRRARREGDRGKGRGMGLGRLRAAAGRGLAPSREPPTVKRPASSPLRGYMYDRGRRIGRGGTRRERAGSRVCA